MKYQSIIFFHNNKDIETVKILPLIANSVGETVDSFDKFNKIEVFTEENRIGIEEVNQFSEWNSMKNENKIKLAIIRQAEKLTSEAQNSILKVIEEPGENTLMVLATSNIESLLETIRSRCIIISSNEVSLKLEVETAKDFFNKDYLERSQILDTLAKESRVVIKEFLMNLLEQTLLNENLSQEEKSIFCEILKLSFIGIDSGTNIKLTLDNINIALLPKE